jgi:hypothetical protein
MKGKTVVITGGTSGIGEIAAERLAQMGARIVLIKISAEKVFSAPRDLRIRSARTETLPKYSESTFAICPDPQAGSSLGIPGTSPASFRQELLYERPCRPRWRWEVI